MLTGSITLGDQSNLAIVIALEVVQRLVSDGRRPGVDDVRIVVAGGQAANGAMVDVDERWDVSRSGAANNQTHQSARQPVGHLDRQGA